MRSRVFIATVLSCVACGSVASAQVDATFPSKIVRIVIPAAAGTSADVMARLIADKASGIWRQSVIVENRVGSPGIISVARAAPDAHTLLATANGYAAIGALNKDLPFDPRRDLVGVLQIGKAPLVLLVPLDLPVRSLNDLIAFAKAKPGGVNYASAGLGSTSHLATELFKRIVDIDIQHVPYRGVDTLTSVMRGDTQMTLAPVPAALELVRGNKIRAIAALSPQRVPALPEVPTFSESGVSFTYNAWFGILAPAATPQGLVDEIGRVTEGILAERDIIDALALQGIAVEFAPSGPFNRTIQSDISRFEHLLSR